MKKLILSLCVFAALPLCAQNIYQARQPNVIVVPYVAPGDNEGEEIKVAMSEEAIPLALSMIKEQFNLRKFPTIDFQTEYQRVQNRALTASAANAKTSTLQAYVDGARADIYVTVRISKDDFEGGASSVTVLLEAKERETGFSLANASLVSDRFRTGKKELTQYALEGIQENFFNQLGQAFNNMVTNGREVNLVLNVDANCELDLMGDAVGSEGLSVEENLTEWVAQNAFKGNGEVRASGTGLNVYMRVPVYDPETGRPYPISRAGTAFMRYLNKLLESAGYKVTRKLSSGQVMEFMVN
ncbi:MAG: DUF6175 family protein [Prevotellaceae bacterium]|jgi:hypothetical protein|nr:DUF6175 family protein [Prevotellaceae bacterium]